MFKIDGSKGYVVSFVYGGTSAKGDYSFLTVQDNVTGKQKYPDKLKIKVWGQNLKDKVAVGSKISIAGVKEFGLERVQDANDKNKWYSNLTIVCDGSDIIVSGVASEPVVEPAASSSATSTPVDLAPVEDDFPF